MSLDPSSTVTDVLDIAVMIPEGEVWNSRSELSGSKSHALNLPIPDVQVAIFSPVRKSRDKLDYQYTTFTFDVYFGSCSNENCIFIEFIKYINNIVVYIRVSTLTQAGKGESLAAQRRQITSYAASKGLNLPDENVDVEAGVSSSTEFQDRPEGPREGEQALIHQMKTMREAGAGYRDIAEWMRATQERKMTFMGVKRTLICADASCPWPWKTTKVWCLVVCQRKRGYVFT